ncbi:methylmalonyl Co-A mutase-associated GTPase MeaB [Kroppenstedtia guangzhouensis]|uniref:Methylmalonyl Co-A mutase-associated GTPase MeaB n=1 Tax=Kroppenstedtia guangzhouensis TaxID=1274356 RepID=A0ABQ1GLR8_9BACL|nr:methylmalonyl Co-A mutase-associated GTPase MeaB [Kroppenstedtia guangzhouensis]GGA46109.1 methylmalonyl Co-A mutase-associated GTPase MeaB [Kroppenstedtia guangzhouensis]
MTFFREYEEDGIRQWADQIQNGDNRMIARAISCLESGDSRGEALLEELYPRTGRAFLVGLTGAPGAGKSTLTDRLITHLRGEGYRVGVLAVDPTSPFTGGAILGDRVRMGRHALDSGVFIRSMGSRGNLGGLARATREAARVLDAAGFEVIVIETVGVGQSEVEIMHLADTVALVLTPGSGDAVQVFKAGIMETADLFVVNKADREGAARLVRDIEEMLSLVKEEGDWIPPILRTEGKTGRGIDELWSGLQKHRQFLQESGQWEDQRRTHLRRELETIIEEAMRTHLLREMNTSAFQRDLDRMQIRQESPRRVARKWLDRLVGGNPEGGGT